MILANQPINCLFFDAPTTTEIYTLSLHDALPISRNHRVPVHAGRNVGRSRLVRLGVQRGALDDGSDRKSTRLNSSHTVISYAVFCLKKKTGVVSLRYLRPHIGPYCPGCVFCGGV